MEITTTAIHPHAEIDSQPSGAPSSVVPPLPTPLASVAHELAAGYSPAFRKVEIASITLFTLLLLSVMVAVWRIETVPFTPLFLGFIVGWIMADFLSGIVHWGADTWGSATFPILGPTLIRSFREHHVDPMSITRHDFIETNGASCLVSLPMLILANVILLNTTASGYFFAAIALSSLAFWTLMTNQAHQWAHRGNRVGPVVKMLQRLWIVLPSPRHAEHHQKPFLTSYCITTGWMNPLLNRIQMFRGLEFVINRVTGAHPRAEDQRLTESAR